MDLKIATSIDDVRSHKEEEEEETTHTRLPRGGIARIGFWAGR